MNDSTVDIHLHSLLEEAEDAINRGDIATAVTRLEALLSTVHKLLIRNAPQGVSETIEAATQSVVSHSLPPGRKRILIVEDETTWSQILRSLLEREGWSVVNAFNGHEALQLLVDQEFDLIMSDIRMPEMDGLEFARVARSSGSQAKIIVLSAYAIELAQVENLQQVVVRSIDKFDFSKEGFVEEFLEMIGRLINNLNDGCKD